MTPDLDELEALEKKATQGPWLCDHDSRPGMEWNIHIYRDNGDAVCFMAHSGQQNNERHENAAALIVSARNALPELIRLARIGQRVERDAALVSCGSLGVCMTPIGCYKSNSCLRKAQP